LKNTFPQSETANQQTTQSTSWRTQQRTGDASQGYHTFLTK
jgi:hypothetical protein